MELQFYTPEEKSAPEYCGIPMAEESVHAGFPSPAEGLSEDALDLNKLLVKHPAATYYVRVKGESMCDAGIYDSDILVVDKALEPYDNCIAVCFIDGEFTLKRVVIKEAGKEILLMPANSLYPPIKVTPENNLLIWGVVSYTIHKL